MFGGTSATACIWNSAFSETTNNKYAGGVFDTNGNGTLSYFYDEQVYTGTWTFVYVNDKLHININLAGNSAVAQFWNIDREIVFTENTMTIMSTPKNIILEQRCESAQAFLIGETGPGGGTVFFDKGFYSMGWRFLEAAPAEVSNLEWGCLNSLIGNSSRNFVGGGLLNSIINANFHDDLNNFYTNPAICNVANTGTVAAKNALIFEISSKKDWFLPSIAELNLMYTNLKMQNIGSFTDNIYWSSTEFDSNSAKTINFTNGLAQNSAKALQPNLIKTRFIRAF